MLAKVISCAIVGLEGAIVEVEADISPGLPSFTIVAYLMPPSRKPGNESEPLSETPASPSR